eukprot:g33410.t1
MVSCGTWHNIILCEKTKLMQVYSHFSCASSQGGWWQLPDDQWHAKLLGKPSPNWQQCPSGDASDSNDWLRPEP